MGGPTVCLEVNSEELGEGLDVWGSGQERDDSKVWGLTNGMDGGEVRMLQGGESRVS